MASAMDIGITAEEEKRPWRPEACTWGSSEANKAKKEKEEKNEDKKKKRLKNKRR